MLGSLSNGCIYDWTLFSPQENGINATEGMFLARIVPSRDGRNKQEDPKQSSSSLGSFFHQKKMEV